MSIWSCFQGLICNVCLCFFYWRHWLKWLMNYWWFVGCKSKGLCDQEIYVWGRVLAWVLAPDDRHGRVTSSMGRATYILSLTGSGSWAIWLFIGPWGRRSIKRNWKHETRTPIKQLHNVTYTKVLEGVTMHICFGFAP